MKHNSANCSTRRASCRCERRAGAALGAAILLALGGCSSIGAKPWERDLMAQKVMQLDAYPLESAMDQHIYFSKEGSSGGRTYAGGGCGCN
ncbi:MAG: DUF4266 domain-containing protein [Gammaproteobacteria bacterium]|nr:DUF4266 domain-containing protein [Gammaproteobacteria bacterium]MBI5617223.1 DUF4266 domain-containing protein [Gammaproteobacteria bacterium]